MHKKIKKLSQIPSGQSCIIQDIEAGKGAEHKITTMGLYKGKKIFVKKDTNPIIIHSSSGSVAIGKNLASKIIVEISRPKMLIVGNPNVGKSAVFSRLTGFKVISSNYPGTTSEYVRGETKFGEQLYEIVDVPGAYSLKSSCEAEDISCRMLQDVENYDLMLYVVDASNLERNLFFALESLHLKKPSIILLNKSDIAKMKGITIDAKKLSELIGVPVIEFVAVTGEGAKNLEREVINIDLNNPPTKIEIPKTSDGKWRLIGEISRKAQHIKYKKPSIFQRFGQLTTKPLTGFPIALAVLVLCFFSVWFFGEGLINYILGPIYEHVYLPVITKSFGWLGDGFMSSLLLGSEGEGVAKTFGVLTDGINIALVQVFAYVLVFYFMFGILEDIGYLPRLAVLLDDVLHKVGLHGFGSIPIMLGIGCKVPAVLSTRFLEQEKQKIIALALTLIIAPCISQSAMIISILSPHGMGYVFLVFFILLVSGMFAGFILNKMMKQDIPEMFMEIPPWSIPTLKVLMVKLKLRITSYVKDAVPFIMFGILLINLLTSFGVIAYLGKIFYWPVTKILGLAPDTISVIILGFLKKDISIALLIPFELTAWQLIVACVFMSMYMPCVATALIIFKEVGLKNTLKVVGFNLLFAFIIAGSLNFIIQYFI
ncbi:MAG: GTP-binding protein [Elusimicrobiaceae bacterium]|nr:GTP-binding protein [Elusimicrobiaceae bacterium]